MRCGHEIIIGGNFMLSEINGEELNEEDDAMVTNAHCPYCGAGYELYDTPESEKKNYPYWNICPNCDSQLDTYKSRNIGKSTRKYKPYKTK